MMSKENEGRKKKRRGGDGSGRPVATTREHAE